MIAHRLRFRWEWLLGPPLAASLILFVVPQLRFLRVSFYRDLGYARIDPVLTAENYVRFFTDPLLLQSLALTVALSAVTSLACLVMATPTAYLLARWRSPWVSLLVAVLLASSFVTIIIKVLGLNVLLSSEGLLNRALLALHLAAEPVRFLGNRLGVVIGLVHYVLPLMVLVLFSVFQTIPRRLEEAAEVHGASRAAVFRTVVFPLSLPGVIAGLLMIFNLCMGAFTTPAVLGGGRVQTLTVLIERKVRQDVDYPFGAAMATVLLVSVLGLNALTTFGVTRLRRSRRIVA